jgi:hypothetical protein
MVTPSPTPALSTFGVVQLPPLPPATTLDRTPGNGLIQAPSDEETAWQLLFYAPASGRLTALETSPMSAHMAWGWTPAGPALVATSSGLVLYDPNTNTAQSFDLKDEVRALLVSKTQRAALLLTNRIAVLDLTTWQLQPVALNARPLAWSPDGKRLLVQVEGAGPAVLLLDQAVPRLYTLPVGLGTGYTGWLSDTRLLAIQTAGTLPPPTAQIVDISGASPIVTPFPAIVGMTNLSFSPDGSRVAVAELAPPGVAVYEAAGMRRLASFPGTTVGDTPNVGSTRWSSDSQRILLTAGHCTARERTVMGDIASGKLTDVLQFGAYSVALSPDSRLLAYTAGKQIFVMPVDGSSAPREVFSHVWGPAPIAWSGDGRTLAFLHFMGGYGRCG